MIDRRSFTFATGAVLAAGTAAARPMRGGAAALGLKARNVVLVHGAFADGSSWNAVTERLQAAGLNVIAVQNPLTSLADDVEATNRALAQMDGPTVLVGHSWGGSVITEAGVDPKVIALVYVAALAPDVDEDFPTLAAKFPPAPVAKGFQLKEGHLQLSQDAFLNDFAQDVPRAKALAMFSAQAPVVANLFAAKAKNAAWRQKPSYYAVATLDRTVPPALQRFEAARMKARTVEVPASHVAMVSQPAAIAALVMRACRGT